MGEVNWSTNGILYFLLITMASAMMYIDSRMDISPSWSEPPIIWYIVAARKGEKKEVSCVAPTPLKALESVQEVERRAEVLQAALIDAENKAAAEEKEERVLFMTNTQFTFHKLHTVVSLNHFSYEGHSKSSTSSLITLN